MESRLVHTKVSILRSMGVTELSSLGDTVYLLHHYSEPDPTCVLMSYAHFMELQDFRDKAIAALQRTQT